VKFKNASITHNTFIPISVGIKEFCKENPDSGINKENDEKEEHIDEIDKKNKVKTLKRKPASNQLIKKKIKERSQKYSTPSNGHMIEEALSEDEDEVYLTVDSYTQIEEEEK
jgi:hypothetical protein